MLALLCAAVSGADPVRLDPKWEKGDRTDVHLVVLLDARVETPIVDYREQRVRDCRYRQTAIEVDGGRPSRVERNFTSYEVKETKRSGEDRPKASTRKDPLDGRTIELKRKEGVLVPVTDAAPPDPESPMAAGGDWAWMLPDKAVKVGDTWKVPSGWHLGSVHFVLVAEDAECKLERLQGDEAWIRFKAGPDLSGLAKFSRKAGRFTHVELEHRNEAEDEKTSIRTKLTFTQ